LDVEAEELVGLVVAAEHGADGVVGADVFEVEASAGDEAAIDFGSVADFWHVGFGLLKEFEELGFEVGTGFAEELGGELKDAAGVGDDLHGFYAGDVVKEPAAGGVHELGMAFELQELKCGDALGRSELVRGVGGEEEVDVGGSAVEDDVDVGVASGPEVFEQRLGDGFGERCGFVAEKIERDAQRPAPLLVPAGLAAVATAVGTPALDAVNAGPGGVVDDFGFVLRWEFFEELAVVGERGEVVFFDPVHGVAERHFAVLVVMSVAFAVGGDVGQLGLIGMLGVVETAEQAASEVFAGVEKAFEGDGAGAWAVVEEDGDGTAFVEGYGVGVGGINGGVGGFEPVVSC